MTNTVSLELAKELWELGLKIETEKWWEVYADLISKSWNGSLPFGGREYGEKKHRIIDYRSSIGEHLNQRFGPYIWGLEWVYEIAPAPSTDELLGVLPREVNRADKMYLHIERDAIYFVGYGGWEAEGKLSGWSSPWIFQENSLPEALGSMCKYLLQNEYKFNGKEIVRKGDK